MIHTRFLWIACQMAIPFEILTLKRFKSLGSVVIIRIISFKTCFLTVSRYCQDESTFLFWLCRKRSHQYESLFIVNHYLNNHFDRFESQVEINTHAGPHRRLWMGPQFTFKTLKRDSSTRYQHHFQKNLEFWMNLERKGFFPISICIERDSNAIFSEVS